MDKQEILIAMRAAAAAPRVPLFAALMAGPSMEGARCVPEDLWEKLGEAVGLWAGDFDTVRDLAEGEGFAYHENHSRGEAHEVWQAFLFQSLAGKAKEDGTACWYVPLDELICLDAGSDDVTDFVVLARLSFKGDEASLRTAVHDLIVSLTRVVK